MKKRFILPLLLITVMTFFLVQTNINGLETNTFQKTYGGSGRDYAIGSTLSNNTDFVIAGFSDSSDFDGMKNNGKSDIVITDYNLKGNVVWEKMYGGDDNEIVTDIIQTDNKEYIVTGYSDSKFLYNVNTHGKTDGFILKIDAKGNILWFKLYGGRNGDVFNSICRTTDGGFIAVGSSNSDNIPGTEYSGDRDLYIVKLNALGEIVWQKLYGGLRSDFGNDIIVTSDGNYLVAANTYSQKILGLKNHGSSDCWLLKIDGKGNILWTRLYGGSGADYANRIIETEDNSFIVAGYTGSEDIKGLPLKGLEEIYLFKIDQKGEIQWQKILEQTRKSRCNDVKLLSDGNLLLAGYTEGVINDKNSLYKGWGDACIIKVDRNGKQIWVKIFGGDWNDEFNRILEVTDGFILTGTTDSRALDNLVNHGLDDYYIIKVDKEGNL